MEPPISTIHLFEPLEQKLIDLLKSLNAEDWNKPTLAKLWNVKDVAAHLLDTQLRALAVAKNYAGDPSDQIKSYQDLVDYLNRLNADWVKAMKRLHPDTLISVLERTQNDYITYLKTLKPFQPAPFSVAWAGEERSYNWFHIAREYTERWHHQQQIREAVNKPGIMTAKFFKPLIQTFMMALPYTFRNTVAEEGTLIKVVVSSEAGDEWFIEHREGSWKFATKQKNNPTSTIMLSPETSWKLFTKALSKQQAEKSVTIYGDKKIGQAIFSMISVMA